MRLTSKYLNLVLFVFLFDVLELFFNWWPLIFIYFTKISLFGHSPTFFSNSSLSTKFTIFFTTTLIPLSQTSLPFLFEYIGEMAKDYIYAIVPLFEDALMERDAVHRQITCQAISHMAIGVYGFGCEDALLHLLNHVWPNIFEVAPHVIQMTLYAIDSIRNSLGCHRILQYLLQGMFHPARRVRESYWRAYNNCYICP